MSCFATVLGRAVIALMIRSRPLALADEVLYLVASLLLKNFMV